MGLAPCALEQSAEDIGLCEAERASRPQSICSSYPYRFTAEVASASDRSSLVLRQRFEASCVEETLDPRRSASTAEAIHLR